MVNLTGYLPDNTEPRLTTVHLILPYAATLPLVDSWTYFLLALCTTAATNGTNSFGEILDLPLVTVTGQLIHASINL
jgi:hypothetical protein